MDIQHILDKAHNEQLTPEEREFLLKELDKEMLVVKEKDPEKYLQFLKTLNEVFQELNTSLKKS